MSNYDAFSESVRYNTIRAWIDWYSSILRKARYTWQKRQKAQTALELSENVLTVVGKVAIPQVLI